MPHLIRKSFTIETAHQLERAVTAACHECVHGHSYTIEGLLESDDLNTDDMVLDFACLQPWKRKVMTLWDHGVLFHYNKRPVIQPLIDAGVWKGEKVNFLQANPTAEVMAMILYCWLDELLALIVEPKGAGVRVHSVRVHETASGMAEYRRSK